MNAKGTGLRHPDVTARFAPDGSSVSFEVRDASRPRVDVRLTLALDEIREVLSELLAARHMAMNPSAYPSGDAA